MSAAVVIPEPLAAALRAAADAAGKNEGWEHFTCTEADAFARVFAAAGMPDAAASVLHGHVWGDADEDDQHAHLLVPDPRFPGSFMTDDAKTAAYIDAL